MNTITKYILLALMLFVGCTKEVEERKINSSINVTDDLSVVFQSNNAPQRIISLAPNLTEMIYELELDSLLIGNTKYCNYPEEAKQIEKVGDLLTVDYEKIVMLNPDLIFITTEGNSKESYEKLLKLGFKVFVSNPRNFEGIKKTFRDISKIFDLEELAKSKISIWNERVERIEKESNTIERKRGMFLVSLKPVMLAGGNTFVNEFLKTVGIENIVTDTKANYPIFSREEILQRNPQIIIHTIFNNDADKEISENYPEWKKIDAVKNKRIIFVDADLFFRPGPRYSIAAEVLWSKVKAFDY
ncbi:MAG: cobalamin-binding protein [Bacteroidetes bacterium]|nr:cobalamin-binding protein [Bacteroidota bacterium]MBU1798796.1 cobalamin-binding protein [Bacteroidota bacterium]